MVTHKKLIDTSGVTKKMLRNLVSHLNYRPRKIARKCAILCASNCVISCCRYSKMTI